MANSNSNLVSEADLLTQLEWDPEKFGIGVRTIDEQHKTLISLANELTRAYATIVYPKITLGMGVGSPLGASKTSAARLARATVMQNKFVGALRTNSPSSPMFASSVLSSSDLSATAAASTSVENVPFPVMGCRQFDPRLQHGSEVARIVQDLVSYTCKYLMVEDHLLETYAYVDRAMQQQDHELFVNEVSFLFKLMEEHNTQISDVRRMLVFLRLWLTGHIPRDRKYAPMLIEKGVGQ